MNEQEPLPDAPPLPGLPEPPKPAQRVDILFNGAAVQLRAEDVFADGCPPNPTGFWTANTLAIQIGLEYSSIWQFLREWNLEDEVEVTLVDDVGNRATVDFGNRAINSGKRG